MISPDTINGLFETLGGFPILLSVLKLHRQKKVSGVSKYHVAFFTAWGIWNLAYYPFLNQWFSFFGGLVLVSINIIWLCQMIYYTQKERLGC